MAEVISLRAVLQARRQRQAHEDLCRCVEIIRASLQSHLEQLHAAPPEEWAVRARKIRKLGELLEYTTSLL